MKPSKITMEDIFSTAKSVAMTSKEKDAIRQQLVSFMERNPVSSVTVPRHNRQRSRIWVISPLNFKLNFKPMMVPIALLIALFTGGGVSLAAEQALPGDVLYPVKLSLNEEVRAAVATASGDEAEWDLRRLERRLEESEQLAVQYGSASGEHVDAFLRVQSNFDAHAERVRAHIEELEAQGEVHAAAELSSNLEVSLRVHERILARLALNAENNETVLSLSNAVDEEGQAVSSARIAAERRAVMGAHTESRTAAEGRLKAAEKKIANVRAFLEKRERRSGGGATTEAKLRLGEAEASLAAGNEKLAAGAFNEAFLLFQRAHRAAQEAKLLLIAHASLAVDVQLNNETDEEETDAEKEDTVEGAVSVEADHSSTNNDDERKNENGAVEHETEVENNSRFHLSLPPLFR